MRIRSKFIYEVPKIAVLELRTEGIICLSGGEYPEWEDEDI